MAAITVTAANVVGSGASRRTGIAGATITAGMPVYKDVNNVYQKSRGNSATAAQCDGISLNGASTGQPFDIQTAGLITIGATVALGESYYVSDAVAGLIIPVTDLGIGDFPTFLGIATTTAILTVQIQEGGVAKA